jgi:peptidoglycan-N-acetylglucosamine deacetylase
MVNKIGYLTIDDAPTNDFRNKVNFLLKNKIPAIFFCIGKSINPSREKEIIYAIEKGFLIGNHSWSHPNFSKLSKKKIKEEIIKTDELLDRLYKEAKAKRKIKVFRFPYLQKGSKNKKIIQQILKELGYRQPNFKNITITPYNEEKGDLNISCTYDTMDWTAADGSAEFGIKTLQDLFNRMDENVPDEYRTLNHKGSNDIIMMHDDDRIKNMFQPLIKRMIEKEIKFELPKN